MKRRLIIGYRSRTCRSTAAMAAPASAAAVPLEIQIHRDQHVVRPHIHRQHTTRVSHLGLRQGDGANRLRGLGANAFADQQPA